MMLLEMAASGGGDRVAVGTRANGLSYQGLYDRSGALASLLAGESIEHLAMLDISSEALPVSLFGSAWAGVPFVPLNYRLQPNEIQALAERVTPAAIVVNDDTESVVAAVADLKVLPRQRLLTATDEGEVPEPTWSMDPEDIAILLFTSGTTGTPKAAVLRHKHLVSYIITSVEFMGAGDDEATLVSVPPYHIAGMAAICSSVYAGRRIVQLPQFDADAWIDLARSEEVTHSMVVPTMLSRIVERLDARGDGGIPSLRALSYGGGKMPLPVITRALELLPETNFVNAYGLTETSSTIAVLGPDDHREALVSNDEAVRRRLTSVGQPLPMLEVSIRDEVGAEVAMGESGEIWVRGEQVSGEYVGRDSRVTAEGWFPTNDGGSFDADGYLYVEGRLDDVIIRGGENISPGEIEDVLLAHDSVRDVAVIGVPDEQWGEQIAAVVVTADGASVDVDALAAYAREHLRSSRTPSRIEVVDELPYNETGKLLRRVLRDQLTAWI